MTENIRRSCISLTFIGIKEAIELAKESNNLQRLKNYESLKSQGNQIIYLCKGPQAPDICDNVEITTCKGCKDYRNIDKT